MKKLLQIAVVALVGLSLVTDAQAFFWRRGARYNDGYMYNDNGYNNCNSCNRGCRTSCVPCCEEAQCLERPCCIKEATITYGVPAKKICGWVCPSDSTEVPLSEARLENPITPAATR
jgi:hypothetical protein